MFSRAGVDGAADSLSLKADASTPFPARDELRRSLSSPFVRLRALRIDGLNGFLEVVLTPESLVSLSQCLEELSVGGKDLGPIPDLSSLKRLRAVRLRGARGPFDLQQFANSIQSLVCSSCRGFWEAAQRPGTGLPVLASLTLSQCQLEGELPVILGMVRGSRSSNDWICRATR